MPEIPGRDEEILQSIINGTSYTVIPQSRIEVLLLQLKDVIENSSQPGAFVIKGRVDTYEDLLLVSNPEPGWVYFVGYSTDTEFKEYVYTDQNVWQFVGYNSITVDSALSTTSENPVQNKVVTTAINWKQATLVFGTNLDNTPTQGSNNPITSCAVYTVVGDINSVLEEVL